MLVHLNSTDPSHSPVFTAGVGWCEMHMYGQLSASPSDMFMELC